MHYTDVLENEFIDYYIKTHKSVFIGLNRILFEIVFLQESLSRQSRSRKTHEYKFAHRLICHNMFSMLVVDMFKNIFDNSKSDTMTLYKLKNGVAKNARLQYKDDITKKISNVWNKAEHVKTEQLVSKFRNKLIAHNTGFEEYIEVTIEDLYKTIIAACRLFSVLSFEPCDFYSEAEIIGYDFSEGDNPFSNEEKNLRELANVFLK